ncbi:MAG: DUF1684 domain-containing protein [Acidobacteria bacterium]|nr:DUF1684 domain-containing protein [Acidobacteriota bacterium]
MSPDKALCLSVLAVSMLLASPAYRSEIQKWRHDREAKLKADGGWLTVTGLSWLHEGRNDIPPAVFELHAGKVTGSVGNGSPAVLRPDSPDILKSGSLTMTVIQRGDRYGIRIKDNQSKARREFQGLHYFPENEAYRVTARFVAQPDSLAITNVLGQTEQQISPGYASFRLHGQELRLYPILESPGAKSLFFIFRDLTSGKETYGAGRFLDTKLPVNGKVVLDFNKAYNPPCAFTPYATCPLPPKRNHLPVRVEAGEKKYGSH